MLREGGSMSSAMRRGGIPGPESRTGLTRPSMTEAEFERRLGAPAPAVAAEPAGAGAGAAGNEPAEPGAPIELDLAPRAAAAVSSRPRAARVKLAKPKRVQRM